MIRRLVWFALLCAGAGCASAQGSKIAREVETVREEQTAPKLLERGRAFASLGDHTRAEQYLSAAIEAGADVESTLPLLLQVCIAERRYWVALEYAEPHLKKRPEDHRLRFVIATLYMTIGKTELAREQLTDLATRKPDYADAHYALAVLFRDEERDPVNADVHFREYLRLEPRGRHATEARGSLLKTVP